MIEENIYLKLRNNTETDDAKELTQEQLSVIFGEEGNPLAQTVISKLENSKKTPPSTSLNVLKAYSNHFHVTCDYLLGLSNNKYADENYQMISRTTGLNDIAINTLKDIKDNTELLYVIDALNFLLSEQELFISLLSNMDITMNLQHWIPAIATPHDKHSWGTTELNTNAYNAFVKKNNNGDDLGVLIIDESVLKSHAIIEIIEILNRYKVIGSDVS